MARSGEHALVIGGSVGGLLAARVLSESFDRVTILDRDELTDNGAARRCAPQGAHAHVLLASGAQALGRLFPDFRADVLAAGGAVDDLALTCALYNYGGLLRSAPSGLEGFLISRPMLETLIRRRIRALSNVTILDRREATALEHAEGRVVGVRHKAAGTSETPQSLKADLVVDAAGRGGRALYWLETLGYPLPREDKVEVEIAYTSREFRREPQHAPGRDAVLSAAHPGQWRMGVLLGQEADRWVVTLGGYFGERAPEGLDGFRDFARRLPARDIYDVVSKAEPLGEAVTYGFKASVRRRYEKLKAFPEGYLVFADGLASFNPVYGQGMSVAACEALALQACLAEGSRGLWRRFFKAAAGVIDTPWALTAGADLAHPDVQGTRGPAVRFLNWYVEKLYRAGHSDAVVARAFTDVANLLAPPRSLFRPAVVARVIRAHIRPPRAPAPLAAEVTCR